MKKLLTLLLLILSVLTVACQDQNADFERQQLKNIAKDPYFKAYLAAMREVQLGIARGEFALKAMIPISLKYPSKSICDIPKEDFASIYGGSLYQELSCKFEQSIANLKQKLPEFYSFSDDKLNKVTKIHDELEGINWAQQIAKATFNRN